MKKISLKPKTKNVITMLVILALLAAAFLLGKRLLSLEARGLTGSWVVTGAQTEGITLGPRAIEAMEMNMELVLIDDGSCILIRGDEPEIGSWLNVQGGAVVRDASGKAMRLNQEGDVLLAQQDEGLLLFTREGEDPAVTDPPALTARRNVPARDFEGEWTLVRMNVMGAEVPAKQTGTQMALVLRVDGGIWTETNPAGEISERRVTYSLSEMETGTALTLWENEKEIMTLYLAKSGELFSGEAEMALVFSQKAD